MIQQAQPEGSSIPLPAVLLWGGKTKARIIDEMLRESGAGQTRIIFDRLLDEKPFPTDAMFTNDVEVLRQALPKVTHFVVCMGGEHGYARVKTAGYLEELGLMPIALIHERGFVESTATLGSGCQVMPGAVVHKFTTLGDQTIVNTNATIDHDCVIGSGVHVMGGAAIAGKVEIGDYATIGTNATVLPFLKIGEGAYVGAGAVVTKDVEPYSVVAGAPARVLRTIEPVFAEDILIRLTGQSTSDAASGW